MWVVDSSSMGGKGTTTYQSIEKTGFMFGAFLFDPILQRLWINPQPRGEFNSNLVVRSCQNTTPSITVMTLSSRWITINTTWYLRCNHVWPPEVLWLGGAIFWNYSCMTFSSTYTWWCNNIRPLGILQWCKPHLDCGGTMAAWLLPTIFREQMHTCGLRPSHVTYTHFRINNTAFEF